MAVLLDTRTGPIIQQDGAGDQPLRQGRMGSLIVSDGHGRYFEQGSRKNLFSAYAAAQTLSVVGTGMTGLQLWNGSPVSNGVNLVLLKCFATVFVTVSSMTRIALCTGVGQATAPTGQTAATRSSNNFIGGAAPQALALNAGTFTNAPTAFWIILHNTVAIATTGEDPGGYIDLEGSIVIPPQCYFAFAAVGGAGGSSGVDLAVMWEEVPV